MSSGLSHFCAHIRTVQSLIDRLETTAYATIIFGSCRRWTLSQRKNLRLQWPGRRLKAGKLRKSSPDTWRGLSQIPSNSFHGHPIKSSPTFSSNILSSLLQDNIMFLLCGSRSTTRPTHSTAPAPLSSVPVEIWQHIASFLDLPSAICFALTCRTKKSILHKQFLQFTTVDTQLQFLTRLSPKLSSG